MIFDMATLERTDIDSVRETGRPAVFLTAAHDAKDALEDAGIFYEGEVRIADVAFCKLETQQRCLAGTLCIPKLLDILGSRYRILFFINEKHIVIVDDDDFSQRLINRIKRKKTLQRETKEKFIYDFIAEFISRDLLLLGQYEQRLMALEDDISDGKIAAVQNAIAPIRRELLALRGYYDELMDLGRDLEENENRFFVKKRLKYFGTISDRADRLMGKTAYLLEYAQQVRDACQAHIDAQQNRNMAMLTVISTIFFPLSLITGWYGMNFQNMPELEKGYPGVILLSICVLAICIIIFKKKKFF